MGFMMPEVAIEYAGREKVISSLTELCTLCTVILSLCHEGLVKNQLFGLKDFPCEGKHIWYSKTHQNATVGAVQYPGQRGTFYHCFAECTCWQTAFLLYVSFCAQRLVLLSILGTDASFHSG